MATVQKHPIKEAERYLQNAKEILSEKAGKNGDLYTDPKYIKMAGNTAWNGVLVALDGALGVKEKVKNGHRPDFKVYNEAVHKKDKKMTAYFVTTYDTLHKTLGYDGNLSYKIVQAGLEQGKNMITWASKHYKG